MTPLKIGAALSVRDLPAHRGWLMADQRDLEIQDFLQTKVLLGDWQTVVDHAKQALDGFTGRLGIHGPFLHVPMGCNDPELMPIVTKRYLTGLDAAVAFCATKRLWH